MKLTGSQKEDSALNESCVTAETVFVKIQDHSTLHRLHSQLIESDRLTRSNSAESITPDRSSLEYQQLRKPNSTFAYLPAPLQEELIWSLPAASTQVIFCWHCADSSQFVDIVRECTRTTEKTSLVPLIIYRIVRLHLQLWTS